MAAPSDFVQLKESMSYIWMRLLILSFFNLDIFVDRKPRKFAEAPICMCKDSGDPTCGESCLNRYNAN